MSALSSLVVSRPWPFILFFLLFTAGFATQLPRVEIDPEVKNQLPDDMPARQHLVEIERRFGGSEMVLVILQAPDVLAPEVLEQLQAVSDGLGQMPGVHRVISPFTLPRIEGSPDGQIVIAKVIDPSEIPRSPEARAALAERLSRDRVAVGNVLAPDLTSVAAIAMLETGVSDDETHAAVQKLVAAHPTPAKVTVGGMPEVRVQVSEDIRADLRKFVPVGLLIVIVFLYACFRDWRGVLLPFVPVVMSVILALGLLPILGWKLQIMMVTLPVILLAVSNDYGIHLVARYQEINQPGSNKDARALAREVLDDLGGPVLAAGLTTMGGLLCLMTHIVVPAVQLGILAAVGVAYALLVSVLWIPAVIALLPVPKPVEGLVGEGQKGILERGLAAAARATTGAPALVLAATLLVVAVCGAGFQRLQIDTNPVNYYAESAPVARTSQLVNQAFGGSTELAVMFEADNVLAPEVLGRIDDLATKLRTNPHIGLTSTPADLVTSLHRAVTGDQRVGVPESGAAIEQLMMMYSMGGSSEDLARLMDEDRHRALLTARISSLSTQDIQSVVALARDTLGDAEGVTLGGFGVVFSDLVDAVVEGQVTSLALSLFVVFVLCAISFRSLGGGLLCIVPLLLALPVLFGSMGWFGIELNVVTAMLSSIMVGVGVDYTIHFLWRYREERRAGFERREAAMRTIETSGRGIVFNALSVIVGFAILLVSSFLPVQFFGFLVVVSITACLLGALVVLPAMVLVYEPAFLRKG